MRPSRFTEAQIVAALRKVSEGTPAIQVCRSLEITQTTFYRWRKRYGVMSADGTQEVRKLREENEELKQMVANLMLDKKHWNDARRRS